MGLKQYEHKERPAAGGDLKLQSYVELLLQFDSIELEGSVEPLRAAADLSNPFGFEAAESPYGQDMSVIPDDAIKDNLFLFAMKHLRLENFDWGWTTLPEQKSPAQSPAGTFPAGQRFRARIVTAIDSDTAAPGDALEALLLSPIPGKDGREWAPAGTRLHGRLLGLRQKQLRDQGVVELLMQFESIELNGSEVPFQAAPDLSGLSGTMTGGGAYIPEVSVVPDKALRMNFFVFRKQHLHLEKFDWDWTTLGTPDR